MLLAQWLNLGSFLRRCAQTTRYRAPRLFGHVASNRILRALYRRMAHPNLYRSAIYGSRADESAGPVVEKTINKYEAVIACMNGKAAVWKPGKRIDA